MSEMFHPPQGPCYADLKGKTALVTGGGSGIGKGITLRLAVEGMRVFLCGRTEKSLLDAAGLVQAAGGQAEPIVADLSRAEDMDRMFEQLRAKAGALDLLVHNAAMLGGGPFVGCTAELWRKMFATNADSAFYLAKKSSEIMIPRRSGNLIFISTIGGLRAHYDMVAYDASKGALDSLTRALAIELAQYRIRVNGVAPGSIMTREPAFDAAIPLDRIPQSHVPNGRRGTPADIAAAVAFLASAQSDYIVGQTIYVDGGATTQLCPRAARI